MPTIGTLTIETLTIGMLTIGMLGLASGCGAVVYTADVISAESVVAEAEHAGAPELSPYEYYAAREYLLEAHEEASEASYEDAIRYAQAAGRLGREARDAAQRHRDERAADADRPLRRAEGAAEEAEQPPTARGSR